MANLSTMTSIAAPMRQRARATVVRALVLIAACVLLPALSASPAHAANCFTFQNLQADYTTRGQSPQPMAFEGAAVQIKDRSTYGLCTSDQSDNNFITVWSMIFDANGAGWVQSGTFIRWSDNGCVRRWSQTSQHGTSWSNYFIGGCSQPGETHQYWQQSYYTGSSWVIRSNIDQTIIRQTLFSPFASWTKPFQVAFSAEAYYAQDNIPGTATYPEDLTSAQVQNSANDAFYTTCGNAVLGQGNSNPNNWGIDSPSCDHYRMWSK